MMAILIFIGLLIECLGEKHYSNYGNRTHYQMQALRYRVYALNRLGLYGI